MDVQRFPTQGGGSKLWATLRRDPQVLVFGHDLHQLLVALVQWQHRSRPAPARTSNT
jgi:hypothetical protein